MNSLFQENIRLVKQNRDLHAMLTKMSTEWAELLTMLLNNTPEQLADLKEKLQPQFDKLLAKAQEVKE